MSIQNPSRVKAYRSYSAAILGNTTLSMLVGFISILSITLVLKTYNPALILSPTHF